MITLEQTIADMNDVVFSGLPVTELKAICDFHQVAVEDIRMGSFIIHNLIDNGLIDMTDDLATQPIVEDMLRNNNIIISGSLLDLVIIDIYNETIIYQLNH